MMADADISQFLEGLRRAGGEQLARAKRAVDVFGVHVLGDAQDLAPVDTGALKASSTDLPAAVEGGSIAKQIGFNTEYAAAVHEVLTNEHPQGEAKFLENALRANADKFGPFVADRVKGGGA